MFTYSENTYLGNTLVATDPGLLRCDVDGSGNVQNCSDHAISYRLYQDWSRSGNRALYVYEDPDDPAPENRGVIECSGRFPLSNCQQRELTTNLEAGPGEWVMFVYEPLGGDEEESDGGIFGFFSDSSSSENQTGSSGGEGMYYPESSGAMQCRVTQEGLLEDCKKLDVEYQSAKASGEET